MSPDSSEKQRSSFQDTVDKSFGNVNETLLKPSVFRPFSPTRERPTTPKSVTRSSSLSFQRWRRRTRSGGDSSIVSDIKSLGSSEAGTADDGSSIKRSSEGSLVREGQRSASAKIMGIWKGKPKQKDPLDQWMVDHSGGVLKEKRQSYGS